KISASPEEVSSSWVPSKASVVSPRKHASESAADASPVPASVSAPPSGDPPPSLLVAAPAHPTSAATPSASGCASARVGWRVVQPPLSLIERSKSGGFGAEATCRQTLYAPADSPKLVTFCGSPPNFAMLAWTHCIAKRWSQ